MGDALEEDLEVFGALWGKALQAFKVGSWICSIVGCSILGSDIRDELSCCRITQVANLDTLIQEQNVTLRVVGLLQAHKATDFARIGSSPYSSSIWRYLISLWIKPAAG